MGAVVIGMDPHKRSATIEVMDRDETILGGGRYATDIAGYAAMLKFGKQFGDRTWAIEGCNGIGKHIANRLLADGELVGVPAKHKRPYRSQGPGRAFWFPPSIGQYRYRSQPIRCARMSESCRACDRALRPSQDLRHPRSARLRDQRLTIAFERAKAWGLCGAFPRAQAADERGVATALGETGVRPRRPATRPHGTGEAPCSHP
jgi:hypothetical protein